MYPVYKMACEKNVQRIANDILQYIDMHAFPGNAIVVFDIDDTLITAVGEPIRPMVDLYRRIQNRGISTAIITARSGTEKNIGITMKQLSMFGITGFKLIYFISPKKANDSNYFHYKTIARKNIHERGYKVIISIGDKDWDIGEYGGIGVKVPVCKIEKPSIIQDYFNILDL